MPKRNNEARKTMLAERRKKQLAEVPGMVPVSKKQKGASHASMGNLVPNDRGAEGKYIPAGVKKNIHKENR